MMKMKYYLQEMRVHHYIKNLLVFAPLLCSGQFLQPDKLLPSIYAFLSFCFISSAGIGAKRSFPSGWGVASYSSREPMQLHSKL